MPSLVIPNGYAEIGVEFARTGLTRHPVITFGVKLKAAPTPTTIEADFKAAWTAAGSLNGAQPSGTEAVYVRYRATYGGLPLSGVTAATWVHGGGAAAMASPAVSLVARKATGLAGRKYRGRVMFPWCSEGDVNDVGTVLAATITGYNSALAIFLAAMAAAGRTAINGIYLLHRDGSTPTAVTSMTLRSTVGTVRQRQPIA
jgi:hypothetical protein